MTTTCTRFYLVRAGDGCYDIVAAEKSPLPDLYAWNSALGGDCSGLWVGYNICVGSASSSRTTTTVTTATTTQTGMARGCRSFYRVKSGDGCYDISASHENTLQQFYLYNPAVGGDCGGLWLDYYVCVGV
ncbi:hypothetical protein BDV12DRAFT_209617 [Aspergillus spectabilis]